MAKHPGTTRRGILTAGAILITHTARAAEFTGRQFHNQPADSDLHRRLSTMWQTISEQTGGRIAIDVVAQNGKIPGSDPQALDMLQHGELQFFCLAGDLVARLAPPMDVQGIPFAYSNSAQVHAANDGALGEYLCRECLAVGIYRFQYGLLENGFHQLSTTSRKLETVADMEGLRVRVPDGDLFRDTFKSLGATSLTFNFNQIYEVLQSGRADALSDPLAITEANKFYEVTRYFATTNHMWTGFNLLANLGFWQALPDDIKTIIERNVRSSVAAQRSAAIQLNASLQPVLERRGMVFTTPDRNAFRERLGKAFYARWKTTVGSTAWALLESTVGPVA